MTYRRTIKYPVLYKGNLYDCDNLEKFIHQNGNKDLEGQEFDRKSVEFAGQGMEYLCMRVSSMEAKEKRKNQEKSQKVAEPQKDKGSNPFRTTPGNGNQ